VTEDNQERLTDHSYDGIQEYDNPTPGWWTWLFVATIVFSVVYFGISALTGWQLGAVPFYERAVVANMQKQYGTLGEVTGDAQTLLKLAADEKWSRVGAVLYQAQCLSCHGREGEGLTGPNLTDDAYIHVAKIEDLVDVVARGRGHGAMPAFDRRMQPVEQVLVSAYVASLRGRNRPGRAAEGRVIAPWPAGQ
jgi:cytochrome c oxidase cbb3-type subunit III